MLKALGIAAALVMVLSAPVPPEPARAATRPAGYVPPPWETNPEQFIALAGDLEFFRRFVPGHAQRWQQYRLVEMTPVEDEKEFLGALEAAVRQATEHLPEMPKDENGEVIRPIPAAPAAAPEGPMSDELFRKLAVALHDQLLFMQDRPFEFQEQRWLAGRTFSTHFPDDAYDATKDVQEVARHAFGEEIDAEALAEREQWALVERFYEHRRAAAGGGFNVTGAALAAPMGMRVGVYEAGDTTDSSRLFYRVFDEISYWQGDLIACGLRVTWPLTSPSAIVERDGKLLRAEIRIIVETKNRDRAPLTIHAYFDPKEGGGKWQVASCCFASSPFAASVTWVR